MSSADQVAGMRANAARIAEMTAELRSLGFAVFDRQELADSGAKAVPMLRALVRAGLVTSEIANRIRATHAAEANVLYQAATVVAEVATAVEDGRLAMFARDAADLAASTPAPADGQSAA